MTETTHILELVHMLHREAGFDQPPLDLRAVFRLRPDVLVEVAEGEGPVELLAEGDDLRLIVPRGLDPFENRLRFAHALGHAVLHRAPVLCAGEWSEEDLSLDEPNETADALRERQAHMFALELLMPMDLFEAHSSLRITLFMKGEEVDQEVNRLVPIFEAPSDAVRARLHLLMDRHFRMFAGIPPRKF